VSKVLAAAALVGAVVLGVICAAAVKWYVFDVLIGLRGQPDQSLQFWGLALLFAGIWAGACAVGLAVVARRLLTTDDPAPHPPA
jgi:multisubunit Na+/H+ antiporter MnhE subunit